MLCHISNCIQMFCFTFHISPIEMSNSTQWNIICRHHRKAYLFSWKVYFIQAHPFQIWNILVMTRYSLWVPLTSLTLRQTRDYLLVCVFVNNFWIQDFLLDFLMQNKAKQHHHQNQAHFSFNDTDLSTFARM